MYRVSVKPDYRWNDCQIGGLLFSKKEARELASVTPEILNSPLLVVEEIKPTEEIQPVEEAPARRRKGE